MKAVVLVGGEGTRLRPLTDTTPKPLLPFLNRPFLHHLLDRLAAAGVEEAVLSSPYLEAEFRSFLAERGGVPAITWVTEQEPLGTGGAVAGAASFLEDAFLVLNGDILTDLDFRALVDFHRGRGAVATIALTPVEDARPFGLVELDPEARVLAFREKPTEMIPGTVNAGTYVLEPGALEVVPRGRPVSIERETFPRLIDAGASVLGFVSEAYWRDLGTPEAYLDAHIDALEGRIVGIRVRGPLLAEDARVDAEARVSELVVAGPGSRVEGEAIVDRSVLHAGAVVGRSARVEGSILGPNTLIEPGAVVRDSVLGDGVRVEPGARLDGARLRSV